VGGDRLHHTLQTRVLSSLLLLPPASGVPWHDQSQEEDDKQMEDERE
jgi:hypothetical protein